MLNIDEYQEWANSTCTNESTRTIPYLTLGLCGESGEVAEKVKKNIRDGLVIHNKDTILELGDVLWYLSNLATVLGYTMSEVAEYNQEKINSRKARGTQQGSGDHR